MFTALACWRHLSYYCCWLISCPWFLLFQDVNTWARHHTPQVWCVADFNKGRWLLLKARCVKQQFADGMQRLFKGAQLVLCHCWLGFFPLLSILTVEQANWSCRYHGPGVQPWLIVTLWPFLDVPAKDSWHFPSLQQNRTCLGGHTFGTPIHICLPYPHHPPPLPNPPILTSRNNVARLYTHRSKERAFLGHS